MDVTLECLEFMLKIMTKRSNPMWEILLGRKEEAKKLAGSILTTKTVHLQTEIKSWMTSHEVPMDTDEYQLGSIFSRYGQVGHISSVTSN